MGLNLNVKIKKRGAKLYVEYSQNGKLIRKSTGLDNSQANIRYINKEIIPNIQKSQVNNKEVDMFGSNDYEKTIYYYLDLVLQHSKNKKRETIRVYTHYINKFKSYFKNRYISSILRSDIDSYLLHLQSSLKKASVKLAVVPLKKAFDLAYKDGLLDKPFTISIDLVDDKSKKESFTSEEINLLLSSSDGSLKDYIYIALHTGLRISEILGLKWSDINFKENYIHIQRIYKFGKEQLPKSNKTWYCPINPKLKKYLSSISKKCEFVISYNNSYYTTGSIYAKFVDLQKKLNFKNVYGTHILRHTFISQNMMAGNSPHIIKLFTGHSSVDMINNVYTHCTISTEDIEKYNQKVQIRDT
jgi:integrase